MLNPIPIQYLALLAYFVLRFGAGIILIHLALRCYNNRHNMAACVHDTFQSIAYPSVVLLIVGKLSIGLLFLLGFYTQYAAIALILMSFDLIFTRRIFASNDLPPRIFYVLLLFVGISLLITGAGAFAVDLPI